MDDLFGSDEEDGFIGATKESNSKVEPREISLYTEVRAMPHVGGQRGVFATQNLKAGCLLSAEKPFTVWNKGVDFGDLDDLTNVILQVIRNPAAAQCTKLLHPMTLDDCDPAECADIRTMFEQYDGKDIMRLASEARTSVEEVIRIALTLQHNGFNSGLYEKQSLFNHACAPNCIKLVPPGKHSASEIWTVKEVPAGEELVICYFSPRESAAHTVREYLRVNHRFLCTCSQCQRRSEVVPNAETTKSSADESATGVDTADSEVAYEQRLIKVETALSEWKAGKQNRHTASAVRAIYADALSLLDSAAEAHHESVPLSARACRCVVSAILSCFEASEICGEPVEEPLAVAFVRYNLLLLQYQRRYLTGDHPDVGATMGDIAEGILSLKRSYPKAIGAHFTNADWSAVLHSSEMPPTPEVGNARVGSADFNTTPPAALGAFDAAMVVSATQCVKHCQAEAKRVKSLYATALKYPAAMKLLTAPAGGHYWGGAQTENSPL
jgi:hypothetical protein